MACLERLEIDLVAAEAVAEADQASVAFVMLAWAPFDRASVALQLIVELAHLLAALHDLHEAAAV